MGEETLTIFPTSEYKELGDTLFALLLSYEDDSVEPRVVYDSEQLDADEAEEIAMEILDILQRRDIIIPQSPTLN
jgi:hypothetical protein